MKKYIYLVLMLISLTLNGAQECKMESASSRAQVVPSKNLLKMAIYEGNLPEIEDLLNKGVNTKEAFYNLISAIRYKALKTELAVDIVRMLLEHNIDINQSDILGKTPLGYAIGCLFQPFIERLINKTKAQLMNEYKKVNELGADILIDYGNTNPDKTVKMCKIIETYKNDLTNVMIYLDKRELEAAYIFLSGTFIKNPEFEDLKEPIENLEKILEFLKHL